jgi:preprotein translocase subunit SecG
MIVLMIVLTIVLMIVLVIVVVVLMHDGVDDCVRGRDECVGFGCGDASFVNMKLADNS